MRYNLENQCKTRELYIEGNKHLDNQILNLMKYYDKIIFSSDFNQPITQIPANIKYLKFGDDFDQSIDNLPANLEYLYLGWEFNHHLHYLPPNLLILDISKCKMTNLFDLSNINQNTTIIKSVPNSTSSSLFNVINESDITKGIIHCLYITLKNYFYNVILLQNHRYKIIFRNNLIILAGYFTYKYLINIITKEWDNH